MVSKPQPTAVRAEELVVLLDDNGDPCGTALKSQVHTTDTPLHLAFSCWAFDEAGRTLLSQRAAVKRTWPGIWTNTFCGHPGPGEDSAAAVHRRAADELGVGLLSLDLVLPNFRYRAAMPDGIVENEICPVYVARLNGLPAPDESEVGGLRWIDQASLLAEVGSKPEKFSPWMKWQLDQLIASGSWPVS